MPDTAQVEEQEPNIDDMELDGMASESVEDYQAHAASLGRESEEEPSEEPQGGQEAIAGEQPAPTVEELTRERDEAQGRAIRHYRELKELRERMQALEQGQQPQQQAGEEEPAEPPPEWDPDNPAPYLRYQAEQGNRRIELLEQMLLGQQRQTLAERQQQALATIDNHGVQRTLGALGMIEGVEGDPEYADAHTYVMTRARDEVLEEMGLTAQAAPPEALYEVNLHLARYTQAWTRQQVIAGKDPVEVLKRHAQRIGWQPPAPAEGGEPAQQRQPGREAAPKKQPSTGVFRRPSASRAGGGGRQVPKVSDFDSEDEFFNAMDSGLLSPSDVDDQIVVERPGVW